MEVEGRRILDSNFYQQITVGDKKMVVQRYDKVGRLVSKDYGPKRTKSKQALSTRLRKCDDETVKSMVLDYFLDYNKVASIYEDLNLHGTFYSIVLDSTLGKRLRFKTFPREDIAKKIYDKYRFDRDEFLINLEGYYKYSFETVLEHSSYEVEGTSESFTSQEEDDKTRRVFFCLAASHDENFVPRVREDEAEFFGRAISLIMGDEIVEIEEVKSTNELGFLQREYLIVDKDYSSKVIHISSDLVPKAEEFLSQHNSRVWEQRRKTEVDDEKIYQMKMEEF